MKHRFPLLVVLCACLGATESPTLAPPLGQWFDWSTTTKATAYASVRADTPMFEDQALWPLLEKNEAYHAEVWTKARLLTWAKPGDGGDWLQAANWLEDGKPASSPPDKTTDVLLPAAERPYVLLKAHFECRHITFERGSSIQGGDGGELLVHGNCWVKLGGNPGINVAIPVGSRHTFHRNDNPQPRNTQGHPFRAEGFNQGHYIHVRKDQGASVEYLGGHHAQDKVFFKSGTVIIGPDSFLMSGGWNRPIVEPPATLVLMSGAMTGQRDFNDGRFCEDSLRVEGVLLAGTKERPLVRDAVLSLNYKDVATYSNARGLIVTAGGSVAMHSRNPQTARLVLRWSGVEESRDAKDEGINPGADVPRRICLSILGKADLDGVLFMDVDKGGIQLADLTQKEAWKHVVFGDNCGADATQLYALASGRSVAKKKAPPQAKTTTTVDKAVGAALYESQVWEPTRQLTWAKPGQGGDPALPANWLEHGKPASVPADRSCDLVLPKAAKPYTVGGATTVNVSCRHLTVESNANLESRQFIAYGNVWVRQGGSIRARAGGLLKGLSHTFVRDDNPGPGGAQAPGLRLGDLSIRKGFVAEGSTVELLGRIALDGELRYYDPSANNNMSQIGCAALVIGPDATVEFSRIGNRSEGLMGVIQLMSGAVFQRNRNALPDDGVDLVTAAWHPLTILAGTPERPLTKDAVLGLSAAEDDSPQSFGLLLRSGNAIRVSSADPAKARLVLRWHGHGSEALTKRGGTPRIRVGLFGDCQFDGVLFDHLAAGGLILPTATLPTDWKHVAFGPGGADAAKAITAGTQPPKR